MNSLAPMVLPPLSAVYGAITRARLALYKRGALSVSRLAAPVISVGNITTGGTGKTPLVEWVARTLDKERRKTCILMRGYGRENPSRRVIVSDGVQVLATARESGDEAFMLASNLKGVAAVITDADRVSAGKWAISQLGVDTFILDDGFQHLRLERDTNIVTVDATSPWGEGRLLPYGRLREPLSGLQRADCILVTRADQVEEIGPILKRLEQLSGKRPVFLSQMRTCGLSTVANNTIIDSAHFREGPIVAFCGVGNPKAFFHQLLNEGYELALSRVFPDHHWYDQRDLRALSVDAKRLGARALVTTGKDAVKLTSFDFEIPCYVLQTELVIEENQRLLEIIRMAISNRENEIVSYSDN